jgi:hypothetical protein
MKIDRKVIALSLAHKTMEKTLSNNNFNNINKQDSLWKLEQTISGTESKKIIENRVFYSGNSKPVATLYTIRLINPSMDSQF